MRSIVLTIQEIAAVMKKQRSPIEVVSIQLIGQDFYDAEKEISQQNILHVEPTVKGSGILVLCSGYRFFINKFNTYKRR